MLLYLVRHGDPNYEKDCLTDRGREQARAVADRMERSGIQQIYSSPMGRAIETAQPTCERLGLPCLIEDWAKEMSLDEAGITLPDGTKKAFTHIPNTRWRDAENLDLDYAHALTAEGFRDSRAAEGIARVERCGNDFLERLGYKAEGGVYRILRPNEERVALFCHAAMMRAWLSVLLHIPAHMMWAGFLMSHTSVTILEFKNNESGLTAPRCLCFSDVGHLYAAGLDLKHNNGIEL